MLEIFAVFFKFLSRTVTHVIQLTFRRLSSLIATLISISHGTNKNINTHNFIETNIGAMSSLNLITHAVIDEIGLEGLDGITLEST